MQSNLQEFLRSRGMENIAFEDITEEFGKSFKIYLKTVHNRRSSYINRNLTWLNRLIYIAIDQDVLRCNPLGCLFRFPVRTALYLAFADKVIDRIAFNVN